MSERILDFDAADVLAKQQAQTESMADGGPAYVVAFPPAYRAALEAQAQAAVAAVQDRVDKLKKERIEYQDTVSGVCAWAERRGAPRFTQANRASVLAALDHALTMQTTPRPTAPDMGTWMERAEIAEAKLADYEWSAQTCAVPVPLRAEHQRLKDAVVGDVMSEYYAREKYRTGGDPWKALHQDNTSPRAALAAFEAQHPEVTG